MLLGYSKLFVAGLSFPHDDADDDHKSPPTSLFRPRPRSESILPSHQPRPSTATSTSTTLSIFSPVNDPAIATSDGLYFTFKTARKSKSPSRTKPIRRNENDLHSFLSLDLAESIRSMSIRSRRQLRVRGRNSTGSSTTSMITASEHNLLFPSSIASLSIIQQRRRASALLPKPKPLPHQFLVAPLPPIMDEGPFTAPPEPVSFDPARTPTQQIARKPSIATTMTVSSAFKRANRTEALAALEGKGKGRHKLSFWDEEDVEDDSCTLVSDHLSSSSSSSPSMEGSSPVFPPAPTPFSDLVNFATKPARGDEKADHRRRASPMSVPPSAFSFDGYSGVGAHARPELDPWKQVATGVVS